MLRKTLVRYGFKNSSRSLHRAYEASVAYLADKITAIEYQNAIKQEGIENYVELRKELIRDSYYLLRIKMAAYISTCPDYKTRMKALARVLDDDDVDMFAGPMRPFNSDESRADLAKYFRKRWYMYPYQDKRLYSAFSIKFLMGRVHFRIRTAQSLIAGQVKRKLRFLTERRNDVTLEDFISDVTANVMRRVYTYLFDNPIKAAKMLTTAIESRVNNIIKEYKNHKRNEFTSVLVGGEWQTTNLIEHTDQTVMGTVACEDTGFDTVDVVTLGKNLNESQRRMLGICAGVDDDGFFEHLLKQGLVKPCQEVYDYIKSRRPSSLFKQFASYFGGTAKEVQNFLENIAKDFRHAA